MISHKLISTVALLRTNTWRMCVALLVPGAVLAQAASFVDVASERGLSGYAQSPPTGGIQAVDHDQDGDIDLFVGNEAGVADQLYRNDGSGQFEEIAGTVGLAHTGSTRTALWIDYDGDGDLDLLRAGDCRVDPLPATAAPCDDPALLHLHAQQNDGNFVDVTEAAGLALAWGGVEDRHRGGLAAADLDHNGYVDIYIATWNDRPWLFLNNGDGSFTDQTSAAGIATAVLRYHQPIIHDFDGNGWLDIYQTVDFHRPNRLWLNLGHAQFNEAAASAGVNSALTDMGVDLGDFDNDGDFDLYITNLLQGSGSNLEHNLLYRNDSNRDGLQFTDIARAQGVEAGWWGWGTSFVDIDLDGDLDLVTTNGRENRNNPIWETDPSRLFRNTGSGPVWFQDDSAASGFNDTHIGSGLVALDMDRDGDPDLAQVTMDAGIRLLENRLDAPTRHWLCVRPRQAGSNRFLPGSVVRVSANGISMSRLITAGKSTLSQEPYEACFGLGAAGIADQLVVELPGGCRESLGGISADRVISIEIASSCVFADGYEPR